MSAGFVERPHWNDDHPLEIVPDVKFKPFKGFHRFRIAGEGRKPFVAPELYPYRLLLRRPVTYCGLTGCIDIINEDPIPFKPEVAIMMGYLHVESPLGQAGFITNYAGPDNITNTQTPYVLKLTFLVGTPAEYAKLVNSEYDAFIGRERYMGAWNIDRPLVRKTMQRLETIEPGKKLFIVERTFVNVKKIEGDIDGDIDEDKSPDRMEYVWLPENIKKLRTISFRLHQFFGRDNREDYFEPEPNDPLLKSLPVLVS